jgi:DNA-directed RNA polymerase subunit H (RpoH/RPB5)
MSKTEVSELLSEMEITANNLPKILVTDPQAVKIEAKAGDVLEINREDFGRKYKYYRVVVTG